MRSDLVEQIHGGGSLVINAANRLYFAGDWSKTFDVIVSTVEVVDPALAAWWYVRTFEMRIDASVRPVGLDGLGRPDLADQLQRLAALRKQGILTEEEFAAQKARLLTDP